MSRTKVDVSRYTALLAGFILVVSGCSAIPKSNTDTSSAGQSDRYSDSDTDEYSGRLFRFGQDSTSKPGPDNQVQQASLDRSLPQEVSDEAAVAAVVDAAADEDEGFALEDLDPENVFRKIRDATGFGPDEGIARDLFEQAEELATAKKYKAAGEKYLDAAKRWPDSSLEEDALYLAGNSFFAANEYPDALKAYEKLLKKHDYTRRLDKVTANLFAMAQYWEKCAEQDPSIKSPVNLTDQSRPWIDTLGYALRAYDDIRMYDPTGPLADDAVMATATSYFVRGRYEEAARHFELIRTEYPKSEHQLKAHLLEIKSCQNTYQGGYYDAGPLEKAGEVADQALIQFGPELGEERPRIVEAKNRIVEEKASRDWIIGQYYDKRKRYGAARFYYQSILDEYPQTAAAQQARQRLAEIQGEPDKPKNHFAWLTDMFEREQYK